MSKILVTGDFHADWLTSGVPRYEDVCQAAHQTVRAAIEENVDLYVFLGDLADPDDPARVLRSLALAQMMARELSRKKILSVWLSGNHDVIDDGSGHSVLTPMSAMGDPFIIQCDGPGTVSIPDSLADAIVLPYPPASNPYDPAEYVREVRRKGHKVKCVFGHMTAMSGIEEGEESREMNRGRGVEFPFAECDPGWLLFQGHWHRRQTFRTGPYTVHIPGSLVRLNFGEEGHEPQFIIVEV